VSREDMVAKVREALWSELERQVPATGDELAHIDAWVVYREKDGREYDQRANVTDLASAAVAAVVEILGPPF
jgi:hexokinase